VNRKFSEIFRKTFESLWVPIVFIVLAILVGVWVQHRYTQAYKPSQVPSQPLRTVPREIPKLSPPVTHDADSIRVALIRLLKANALQWKRISKMENEPEGWTIAVPSKIPIPSLHLAIQEVVEAERGKILSALSDPKTGRVDLQIGIQDSCFLKIILLPAKGPGVQKAKIAIVIDDFGDRWNSIVKGFLDIERPVTISILPGRQMSRKIAEEAIQRGREVILHLPMEPLDPSIKPDSYMVCKGMTSSQIQKILERSLEDVPGAVGVSNHMGSKATQDRATMLSLLECIQTRRLFFMDSYTIASSVAYSVAQELNLPTIKRDVFLDVDHDGEEIRNRLWDLARRAKRKGHAIGVGHCHQLMLEILTEEMPKIEASGYEFVYLSELIH